MLIFILVFFSFFHIISILSSSYSSRFLILILSFPYLSFPIFSGSLIFCSSLFCFLRISVHLVCVLFCSVMFHFLFYNVLCFLRIPLLLSIPLLFSHQIVILCSNYFSFFFPSPLLLILHYILHIRISPQPCFVSTFPSYCQLAILLPIFSLVLFFVPLLIISFVTSLSSNASTKITKDGNVMFSSYIMVCFVLNMKTYYSYRKSKSVILLI